MLRQWFSRQSATSGNRPLTKRKRFTPAFELLEERAMMARSILSPGIDLDAATGQLSIVGSNSDDQAVVKMANQYGVHAGMVEAKLTHYGPWIQQGNNISRQLITDADLFFDKSTVKSIVFVGSNGDDTFDNQLNVPCTAQGNAGNDILHGGGGNDHLYGGEGADLLEGRGGDDALIGGNGDDTYQFTGFKLGTDTVTEASNRDSDTLDFSGLGDPNPAANTFNGINFSLKETISQIAISNEQDLLDPKMINLTVILSSATGLENLIGTSAQDFIEGNSRDNHLTGGGGNDTIVGLEGNDTINGGLGDDTLDGGIGNDTLHGNDGNDEIYGEDGNDTIYGDAGDDKLHGNKGNDTIYGGAGNDVINGDEGTNSLNGDEGDDKLFGSTGNATIHGGAGNDLIHGVAGTNAIYGDDGDDQIYGGTGVDIVHGGGGDDTIVTLGGTSKDIVYGDAGNDSYWVDAEASEKVMDLTGTEFAMGHYHSVGSFMTNVIKVANTNVSQAVSRELSGQSLMDPLANVSLDYAKYKNFSSNPLFSSSGPDRKDIFQGKVGDCYFVAYLAAVAKANPDKIRQTVVDLGDGTYGVNFHGLFNLPVYVRVDGDLAVDKNGETLFAGLGQENSMWVAIIEKAWAFYRNGDGQYDSISGGNNAGIKPWIAMDTPLMTVGTVTKYNSANAFVLAIKAELDKGFAVTLGGPAGLTMNTPMFPLDNPNTPQDENTYHRGAHIYMVSRVVMDANNNPYAVVLRNPWGTTGPKDDGVVSITPDLLYFCSGGFTSYKVV